jgi:HK97 family phage portal protein
MLSASDGFGTYMDQLTHGYMDNAYVARCVDLRAQAVATLHPIVTDADGNEVDGEHPLKAVIARPNALQSWRDLVTEIQTHYGINGNAYIYVAKTLDGLRLYAVRPDRISAVVSTDPFAPVKAWRIDGGRLTVQPEDVIHIHGTVGEDGITGISPLESAGAAVLQQTEAKKWNRALMLKGAKPSLAIIFRQKLTPKAFQDFAYRYRMQHQGSDNAGSTLILDEDANVVSAGFNARDMDYANGVTVSAREIAIAFQVPPELIGDSANKTYSNAQEANREFASHTVVPLATQMYEAISRRLWPSGDAVLTFDKAMIDELRGDESGLISALTSCDFLTTNEKRARMSYQDVPGGDVVLTTMGKVPLDEVSTPIDDLMGERRWRSRASRSSEGASRPPPSSARWTGR